MPQRSLHRPVTHRKDHPVPQPERHDVDPRLLARPLLREHELAAREIATRHREQQGDLQREDVLTVDVLMQAVVVALPVSKEERRRPGLTRLMASLEERRKIVRIAGGDAEGSFQRFAMAGQTRIERGPSSSMTSGSG